MRVKPFLHVELELIFGMLVLEDIGHLPGTLVKVFREGFQVSIRET